MIIPLTLGFIHQRLTEIKGTDDTEVYFGGLNIIGVGDFYQLPPVGDRFVFQNGRGYVPASTHLWRDLFTMGGTPYQYVTEERYHLLRGIESNTNW